MRAKYNLQARRRYSHPVADRNLVRSDQTVVLLRQVARDKYPLPLRKLRLRDPAGALLLTNQFSLEATAIGQLYRDRWRIEIFFRWIKQHLRIKAFYGRSPNAVLVQVWIAVGVYVLIAILKKRLAYQPPVRSSTDSWHHIVRENPAGMRRSPTSCSERIRRCSASLKLRDRYSSSAAWRRAASSDTRRARSAW